MVTWTKKDQQNYDKERYSKNRDEKLAYQQEYYKQNRDKILARCRERHLLKSYGLSGKDYYKLVKSQQGRCAICGKYEHRKLPNGDVKPLSVDHCHATGKVRELLCNDCNALIGFANENIEVLTNAIKYLQKHTK